MGHLQISAHQLLGATKNKTVFLDTSQRFERQPRARTMWNDRLHLLHKGTPSSLEKEIAVLSKAQNPTQSVKENEETEECVSNETTN